MPSVHLYAEDALCGELGAAIVRHSRPGAAIVPRMTNGFGKIKRDLAKYAGLAAHRPVLVVVDLDRFSCPVALLDDWNVSDHACPGLAFRIAVHECESWLMADARGASEYFGLTAASLPASPDVLDEPKEHLLNLLRRKSRGRRRVLEDVLPAPGSSAKVGLGYNVRLTEFVRTQWSVESAAMRSDSLARAVERVRNLPA